MGAALGTTPDGARADRVRRSPQFRDGAFRNRAVTHVTPSPGQSRSMLRELLFGGQRRHPSGPIPVVRPEIGQDTDTGLHITWFGHATTLVELDGARVLFDPVWSDRCSPSTVVGPRRLHPAPCRLDELPDLDAVIISHDHYDHLDLPTIRELTRSTAVPFVVPLGVGAHLQRWGVPSARIVELDWEESAAIAGLRITSTAAQHFSGRGFKRDGTLWSSWVVAGPTRRVFYTGDSGYFDGYAEIGERHGPFDAALVQIGAYDQNWPDIHMTPEQGVATHLDLRAGLLIPVHWATFNLALHAWTEPADRLWREAKALDVPLAVPRPGERIDVDEPPPVDGWWQLLG
ncbi:Zn-dependent hydrolase [Solihabitans fulvus]|uniref:Zn-dependent hydrolase n=1 Tax=Solihabitans fulvus TaxID=1892852 RepID=A0A5B2XG18_9PSEU|nr:MBL fold metallo-hydrolase [Solihabitans fulvus]KAA2261732.1 Zn-dependent hydrolase [Solihabitans fulvus]